MYYLYILYSISADRYYIGVTNDVANRLRRHNSRHKKGFTGISADWCIVYQECYKTKSEALVRERQLKSWKSGLKIEELIKKSD
ncbi:GIY-YIG nuclease family protein [Sphingobacterium spiritivorum]|uniref:GIY-YIG nuclease family protein n=1 Tax=Sphingobacterium spiritivorum TaxID=258 RepID=UPI0019193143|nr:GIY-YIG nuclease family protein [Sphingobacterium spiritivorum]QQT27389.1 GIY-YIG nuclease family protein [Sphingobacterium spiritivorum]